jgi:hypothetical protein
LLIYKAPTQIRTPHTNTFILVIIWKNELKMNVDIDTPLIIVSVLHSYLVCFICCDIFWHPNLIQKFDNNLDGWRNSNIWLTTFSRWLMNIANCFNSLTILRTQLATFFWMLLTTIFIIAVNVTINWIALIKYLNFVNHIICCWICF